MRRAFASVAVIAATSGCSLLLSTSDLSGEDTTPAGADGGSGGDGSVGDDGGQGGADGGTDATVGVDASGPCPQGRGPVMKDTGRFCIDTTEVTQGQYAQFLSSITVGAMQPEGCSKNLTFLPNSADACSLKYTPTPTPNHPVVCIDWCDAATFCSWAGKRMCRAIGGGEVTESAAFDPTVSEWYAACTNDGQRPYPYGQSFDATACNGPEKDAGGTLPVATQTGCVGGYAGLYDMAGNVTELDGTCFVPDGGVSKQCVRRGGSFDPSSNAKCSFGLTGTVDFYGEFLGFRCCADRK